MEIHINKRGLFFLLFAISGFSGLIYESIWSHYLKLFLGHAAYAQTLVLAIFMGGMALGAWICSRYSPRWQNLLLVYALAEALVGIAAILFHPLFTEFTELSYNSIMPGIGSPFGVYVYKWILASLLILPQSILLGMTFPLMSAGILRWFPDQPGRSIAVLYFSNSIGAAIGVLVSGFLLIAWVGLPGTLITAGLINITLALMVWLLAKQHKHSAAVDINSPKGDFTATIFHTKSWFFTLLGLAFLTGMASFIYEISWIRMLSLVLGSSTHAFELMLSAFILGLAFGGLWIRNRIGQIKNLVFTLAWVQLCMGTLALSTLPLYDSSFELMRWLVATLSKTDSGYGLFNLSSHAIALLIMLPTTFCAGMTLPLITFALLKSGHGEKSIGGVYAANTVGAIIGVLFAVHIGLPSFGLKGLLWSGAAIDIGIAIVLLYLIKPKLPTKTLVIGSGYAAVVLLSAFLFAELDPYKTASGVYRTGKLISAEDTEILYHQDGKAATVDLHRDKTGHVNIRTNGKVDANINMAQGDVSTDEPTMVLAAAIPLMFNPEVKTAAVIGMGSGLSTHTLLSHPNIQSVDTIEIEPAMIEAAQGFRPRVELAYSDVRSHIYIDDAKTYFSTHNRRYDAIISEPSNPWVSGTASLFTREFYSLIPRYLTDEGLLVQWVQLYELNMELVASIIKALNPHFSDYAIYTATDRDILIIGRKTGLLGSGHASLFDYPGLRAELAKIHIRSMADLRLRRLGAKAELQPLFESYKIQANSDYQPVLDLGAAKTRFLNSHAGELVALGYSNPPAIKILGSERQQSNNTHITQYHTPTKTMFTLVSLSIRDLYLNNEVNKNLLLPKKFRHTIQQINRIFIQCQTTDTNTWISNLVEFSNAVIPFLSRSELTRLWSYFETNSCFANLLPQQQDWISLLHALSLAQYQKMANLAQWLLQHNVGSQSKHFEFLIATAMLGEIKSNNAHKARQIWDRYIKQHKIKTEHNLLLRLLWAHSHS